MLCKLNSFEREILVENVNLCHVFFRESETHFSSDTDFEDIEGKNQKPGKGKVCLSECVTVHTGEQWGKFYKVSLSVLNKQYF